MPGLLLRFQMRTSACATLLYEGAKAQEARLRKGIIDCPLPAKMLSMSDTEANTDRWRSPSAQMRILDEKHELIQVRAITIVFEMWSSPVIQA